MAIIAVQSQLTPPFQVLKTVKIRQLRFFEQLLEQLPSTRQGLRNALSIHLSWMAHLTPSTSSEPLSNCLAWMARTAALRSIFQSSLGLPFGTMKKMEDWLTIMDGEINRLADMELESRGKAS